METRQIHKAACLARRYSEGQPGARYYGGNEHIDRIENLCKVSWSVVVLWRCCVQPLRVELGLCTDWPWTLRVQGTCVGCLSPGPAALGRQCAALLWEVSTSADQCAASGGGGGHCRVLVAEPRGVQRADTTLAPLSRVWAWCLQTLQPRKLCRVHGLAEPSRPDHGPGPALRRALDSTPRVSGVHPWLI